MKVAVIGSGSWGTALASVLAENSHAVCMWARKPEVIEGINDRHINPRYLSDARLSENITCSSHYAECIEGAEAVVVVTPSSLMRDVAQKLVGLIDEHMPIIICSKGVEEGSGLLPAEVFEAELGNASRIAVLSGPNHAEEVICRIPTGTVIACSSESTALFFRDLFATSTFRTYTSDDVCGVELCAACKNVIAIAVGISYGIGFGDNTSAMLITRGLAEMSRLVVALGGNPITCMGLAGTGDMIATCTSQHSRNRRFGESLVAGRTLDDFSRDTHMVVEGALACKTLLPLAQSYNVELPIAKVVHDIVWQGADPHHMAEGLASRPLKDEFY